MVRFGEVPVKFSKKNFTNKYADISDKFVNVVKLVKFFWNSYGFLKIYLLEGFRVYMAVEDPFQGIRHK